MRLTTRSLRLFWVVAGVALLVAGAACTSGNNKHKNGTANTAATVAPPVVTSSSGLITPVPVRTVTPGVAVSAPRTPAATGPRTPTPIAGVLGAGDAAAQRALAGAALKQTDLPSGFQANGVPSTDITLPGQTAFYAQPYTRIAQSASGTPDIQLILVVLTSFRDATTAQAQFQDLQSSLTQETGADFKFTPVSNGPNLGDSTTNFMVSATISGQTLTGFGIIWREGKTGAAVVQVGVPGIQSIDQLAPLAQKQDDTLKPIAQ